MNYRASTPTNCVVSATDSTGKTGANQRLLKYLTLLNAQESEPLETMIAGSQHHHKAKVTHDHHHHVSSKRNPKELDNSIHKLLRSRRQDLRNAVKLIAPHCANKKSTATTETKREAVEAMIITVPSADSHKEERRSRSSKKFPKASEAAVTNLPRARLFPYDNDAMVFKDVSFTCAICAAGCSSNHHTLLARLPCGHVFHNTCALRWLGQNCACPVCHYELETDDAEFEAGRRERMKDRKTVTCYCPRTGLHECFFTSSSSTTAQPLQFCKPTTPTKKDRSGAGQNEDTTCSFYSDEGDSSFEEA